MATAADLHRTSPVARDATRADEKWLADVLARAFWDDPIFMWMHPSARSRYPAMRRFFRAEIRANRRHGRTVTTGDLGAAAVWASPGRWKSAPLDVVRMAPAGALLASSPKAAATLFQAMEKAHPAEPHWYLATVGSDPGRKGTGAGQAVIRAVLDDCDRSGLPAYLESSKPENISYYERFGFAVTGEINAAGAPPLFPMWREPGS